MTVATHPTGVNAEVAVDRQAMGIIDLDTHVGIPFEDPADWLPKLSPYLSSSWSRRISEGSVSLVAEAWSAARHFNEPGGNDRTKTPSGERPGSDPSFVRKDHLDRHGIIANVIITHGGPAYVVQTPEACVALTAAFNDFHCEQWLDFDSRFRLTISVPYRYPNAAVEEIQRLESRPGVVGVYLQPSDQSFSAPMYDPILAAANEAEFAVFTHPASDHLYGDAYMGGSYPDSAFERYIGWNDFAASNVANLVLAGVFERYPNLKFIFAEFGWAWLAPLMRRMDHMWQVAPEKLPLLTKKPSQYVLDHIRVTSQPALEVGSVKHENLVLDQIRADRTMCFSSDYPHWDGDDPAQIFRGAAPSLMRKILHDNAVESVGPRILPTN